MLHTSQSLVSQKASSSSAEGRDEGLVTSKNVQEFWQMALAEVMAVLRNNCVSEYYSVWSVFQTCGTCVVCQLQYIYSTMETVKVDLFYFRGESIV